MTTEEDYTKKIHAALQEQGYPNWVEKEFCKVKDSNLIRTLLDRAYMETAQREYKNRHGIIHGLATAYNSVRLFEVVNKDAVESDYMEILGLSKEEVLFMLMIAGLVHDTGRFYDDAIKNHEEHINDAIAILEKIHELGDILGDSKGLKAREMIKRIKELCLCHDKKLEPSGKVEIALMKLADALDVGPHRVYTIEDKPELDCEEEDRLSLIFRKDKCPGRYFGPLSIENVTFSWDDNEKVLEVSYQVKDYACAEEIKKTLNILYLAANNGHENVKKLASRIFLYIKDNSANRYRLYPSKEAFALTRTQATAIPKARIPYVEYSFNILNMDGDTDVELPLQIRNIDNKEGIDGQTIILGGDFPSKWKDIRIKWFEETASGSIRLPRPLHLRSEKEGRNHVHRIRFSKKLGVGDTIALRGKCRWKRFTKVMESAMVHTVSTPTDKLKIDIRFPVEASQFRISACLLVMNIEGKKIYEAPLEPKKVEDRVALISEVNVLEPQHIYGLRWKLEK